ncbi:hypothetical protein FW796_14985 [Pseudomonas sp. 910_21]
MPAKTSWEGDGGLKGLFAGKPAPTEDGQKKWAPVRAPIDAAEPSAISRWSSGWRCRRPLRC